LTTTSGHSPLTQALLVAQKAEAEVRAENARLHQRILLLESEINRLQELLSNVLEEEP
jgi:hypothetical protein